MVDKINLQFEEIQKFTIDFNIVSFSIHLASIKKFLAYTYRYSNCGCNFYLQAYTCTYVTTRTPGRYFGVFFDVKASGAKLSPRPRCGSLYIYI